MRKVLAMLGSLPLVLLAAGVLIVIAIRVLGWGFLALVAVGYVWECLRYPGAARSLWW